MNATEIIISGFIGIVVFCIVMLVGIIMINQMGERIHNDCAEQNFTGIVHYWDADVDCSQYVPDHDVVPEVCCGGSPCTDTYYTLKDNLCHLVLCEKSLFTNKSQCTYPGKQWL